MTPASQPATPAQQLTNKQVNKRRRMISVAFIGQKGGIGKTSTTIHIAAALAERGHRTLVVDTDPQGHCAVYLGAARGPGLRHTLLRTRPGDDDPAREHAPTTHFLTRQVRPGLDLIASDPSASGAALRISSEAMRELRLRRRLEEMADQYDVCLIDVSPTVDLLSTMALLASDAAMILATPHMPDVSLVDIAERLRHLYQEAGIGPAVWGAIPSLLDTRETLARELPEKLRAMGGDVTPSVPRAVKVSQANQAGLTIEEYLTREGGRHASHPSRAAYTPLIEWFTTQLEKQ